MDDQTFRLLMSKLDAMHEDLRHHQIAFRTHVEEDQKVWQEVTVIKRVAQAAIAALGVVATWLGIKHA